MTSRPQTDRKPPRAVDLTAAMPADAGLEDALIGAVMRDPAVFYSGDVAGLRAADLWVRTEAWQAMADLLEKTTRVSAPVLVAELRRREQLVPDPDVVAGWQQPVVGFDPDHAARELRRLRKSRAVADGAALALNAAMAGRPEAAIKQWAAHVEAADALDESPYYTTESIGSGIETYLFDPSSAAKVSSFVPQLDSAIGGGFPRGLCTYVLARPGMGKSRHMIQQAEFTARHIKESGGSGVVLYLSMDGDPRVMLGDYIASRVGLRFVHQLREPRYAHEAKLARGMLADLRSLPIVWNSTAGLTDRDTQMAIRRAEREYKNLVLVIGDYLQAFELEDRYSGETEKTTKFIGNWYKITRSGEFASILAVQLGREMEKRDDKRPRISDGKGSSRIEESAELMLGLYRDEYYNRDEPSSIGRAEIGILKLKAGGSGQVIFSGFKNGLWMPDPLVTRTTTTTVLPMTSEPDDDAPFVIRRT